MKVKLLILMLLAMLFQVNMNISAKEMSKRHRIFLKDIKQQSSHRSVPICPAAFIENSILSIDLSTISVAVTINVKDVRTGEIIHSSTSIDESEYVIDLTGEDIGTYVIEITFNDNVFSGDFIIE